MLPKKNRVNTKEVEKIFEEGRVLVSSSLTFKYLKTQNKTSKVSFIAPKSLAKLAVRRNLLRRLGYMALAEDIEMLSGGILGVFIFKKFQEDVSILKNEIKKIFSKIG